MLDLYSDVLDGSVLLSLVCPPSWTRSPFCHHGRFSDETGLPLLSSSMTGLLRSPTPTLSNGVGEESLFREHQSDRKRKRQIITEELILFMPTFDLIIINIYKLVIWINSVWLDGSLQSFWPPVGSCCIVLMKGFVAQEHAYVHSGVTILIPAVMVSVHSIGWIMGSCWNCIFVSNLMHPGTILSKTSKCSCNEFLLNSKILRAGWGCN